VGCIGLLIAAYSVVQHRLMDVSVFMAKGLGFILTFAILAVPFFFIFLLIEETFFQRKDILFTVILVLLGVGSIPLFNYIKVRVDRTMHQIIVKDKYNYHQILRDFSRRLVTIVDLDRLLNMLADTIEKSMGVKKISIFLVDLEKKSFRPRLLRGFPKGEPITISEPAIQFLQDRREAILRIELDWVEKKPVAEELAGVLSRYGAEVFLPLIFMDRLIGFINLGPKAEEQIYYPEDLNLLYPLANQVAIAIENSNLYDSLKKSQVIIRRADRLSSLGTLVASLAHEIRNPLVSIKTFTQLLPERIEDEEFRNYFLKVASGEIDRLTGLINELLGFARPTEPRLEGEDIHAIIDKMEVLIATEARKKNVTLHKNYAPDLPQVRIDAEQIKQVLLNILLNAIQSIRGEGEIWVETRMVQVPLDEKIEPFIQVEVRDTGVGIPQENLERIFDPFFSTRPEGSGLGLAISHQIIHDHRGFITVESEVAKGTSFKIHLPLKTGGVGVVQKQRSDISR
jgi:signal transduction histidine kinase